ncbi:MAG: 2-succinyl-5-enolpyruvyl-6-hydroxy-3-cyclohexene-1-carboxylic-acid synthase [Acidimicrobiales bacterium]|nr:2-succinyl-5-enolpyruvyl-6-hydroxy-3-cyclohexene-1-carboxylic-acid synthase [Acidimicrobiales bacterium]
MGTTAAATFCATLVDEWLRAGVTEAVVSPGSRSTPLALALAADGRLRLHVHHDERSAAFVAVGLGAASGRPAVVLTTSGTAAVELHPAVVEADQAGVPMLACTADRPPELHDVGGPQTVDQVHLFGRAVRWFADPGVPVAAASGAWRSMAARAVAEACGPPAGPVHLNLPFCDPLVGEPGPLPEGRPAGRPWHERVVEAAVDPALLDAVAATVDGVRGVIVAGAGAGEPVAVHALASAAGWPVLADPRSGCRVPGPSTVAAFDALLRHEPFAADHRPDVVLRLGAPPASKVLAQWLAASGARQVAISADGRWWDPERTAALVVRADPGAVCRALAGRVEGAAGTPWPARWSRAERLAQEALDAAMGHHAEATEPACARAVVDVLPGGATLVVSSSMPVRDVEWYGRPHPDLRVVANRGANGIDGVTSTAVGVALAGPAPTLALVGDVAFLHDANGLLGAVSRGIDLALVVVDNDGGGIFSFLPQATAVPPDRFERLFGTPHGVDPCLVAAAHGVASVTVDRAADVGPAVADAIGAGSVRLVRVRTDRADNVAVHDRLHAAVGAALGGR